jgi:hypothetical protein
MPDAVCTHPSVIITYRFIRTGSVLPRLSTAKNRSVVVAAMLRGAEYTGELVVGMEPSTV